MKSITLALAALAALAALMSVASLAAQQTANPLTKAEIEAIVKEYILQHPEVLLESVRQHQERERAGREQKAKDALTAKQQELLFDPATPATKAAVPNQVSIVSFFDYRCGYCKRVYPTLMKVLEDNKDVRLVFKELPILGPESVVASKAALAAVKQGKYQEFHNALMGSDLAVTAAFVEQTAKSVGLDIEKLKKDMESAEVATAIKRNQQLAQSLGVEATPTFIIGNELVPGAIGEDGFKQLIAKAKQDAAKKP
jgi:protein-disulfide isomerase